MMPSATPAEIPASMPTRPHHRGDAAWRTIAAAAGLLLVHAVAHAQSPDRVVLTAGPAKQGQIIDISPNGVDLEERSGSSTKIPIEDIREIRFGDEPEPLRSARLLLLRKDGAGALGELDKIERAEMEGVRKEIQMELAYVRAAATARRALATGEGVPAAQKAVGDFLASHPRSHHLYEIQELLGDLLARQGKAAEAAAAYGVLEKGPPAIEVRAATLKADLLFGQQKYAEALREYEAAAKVAANVPQQAGAKARLGAELGRARCLARTGKAADAIAAARATLDAADPADSESLGRIFLVLGDAQRAAGDKDRDALISFLTVELVHNRVPDDHAEALFNLVELWEKTNNPERSREARQALESTYPDSGWSRKLGAAKSS